MSYEITQNGNQYTWTVRETGESGKGKVNGNKIVSYVGDKTAVYKVMKSDFNGNPVVLFTSHPEYIFVILYRNCDNHETFLNDLEVDAPQFKNKIHKAMKGMPNPPCPKAIQAISKMAK